MAWYTCADCDYMNTRDRNSYNEAWCGHYRKYYPPADKACKNLKVNGVEKGGDCYLTTAMCDILGQEDHGYILETLRNFRDTYMKQQEECITLLEEYDLIGPEISNHLHNDEQNIVIANTMLYLRIYPAIDAIGQKDFKKAIEIYKDMTEILKEKYSIKEQKAITRQRKID